MKKDSLTEIGYEIAERYYAATTVDKAVPMPVINRANGIYVWDVDDKMYIDLTSGVGVGNIGYNQKAFNDAVATQLEGHGYANFLHHDWHNAVTLTFAGQLISKIEHILGGERKVMFTNSGAETVEAALKLCFAKKKLEKPEEGIVICFNGAFHGRTGYCLPLMDPKRKVRTEYFPMAYKTARFSYPTKNVNMPEEIQTAIEEKRLDLSKVIAVIIEPVQGEGGIYVPDPAQMRWLEGFCNTRITSSPDGSRCSIPFIVDEIQSGWGRTGKMLASEHFGINPDIICLSKAFGGGATIGAAVFKKEYDFEKLGQHSSTFGGNAMNVAAAWATLEIIEKLNLCEAAEKMGIVLEKELKELQKKYPCKIIDVRGIGLMQGIEFISPEFREKVVKEGYEQGLILMSAGVQTLRIMPPLIITEGQLKVALGRLEQAIQNALKG